MPGRPWKEAVRHLRIHRRITRHGRAASATPSIEVDVVGVEYHDALRRWPQLRSRPAFIRVVIGLSREDEANGEVPRLFWSHARSEGNAMAAMTVRPFLFLFLFFSIRAAENLISPRLEVTRMF